MKVKVIADNSLEGQGTIKHLIGNVYEVKMYDEEDHSVSVLDDMEGMIVLNKSEYAVLEA
jgi:hypothetical protein